MKDNKEIWEEEFDDRFSFTDSTGLIKYTDLFYGNAESCSEESAAEDIKEFIRQAISQTKSQLKKEIEEMRKDDWKNWDGYNNALDTILEKLSMNNEKRE